MEKGLSVENLKAYYFANNNVIKAVDDVSFTLNEGESFGIAGESACGKSTLGLCIMRMLQSPGKIVDGKIIMNGIDILAMSDKEFTKNTRWKRISMIFQGAMNALDPVYSIKDQLKEVLTQHGFPQKNIDTRIREVIKQVGLNPSVVNRYPHELSGGMK